MRASRRGRSVVGAVLTGAATVTLGVLLPVGTASAASSEQRRPA